VPGQVVVGDEPVVLAPGRHIVALLVRNTGDRPVQVGSHFHFAETNASLEFDRDAAWGHRLAVAAGTAVRFEPGVTMAVSVVPLAGRRRVPGLNQAAAGSLDGPRRGSAEGKDGRGG
jgi:urease subunit beta